jgi:hypothetical protein
MNRLELSSSEDNLEVVDEPQRAETLVVKNTLHKKSVNAAWVCIN